MDVFSETKSLQINNFCVLIFKISIYIHIKSSSTCKKAAIMRHQISTVAQNLHPDIAAHIRQMSDQV